MTKPQDSRGREIRVGDRVNWRDQIYTIKSFGEPIGRCGTRAITFEEPLHITDEIPDEMAVDLALAAPRLRCPWCGDNCPRFGSDVCPIRPRQIPRSEESEMKIEARYAQVSDTSHGCDHAELRAIVDDGWQMIQCSHCLKRWDSLRGRHRITSTVLDEAHDFQRFERVTPEGETTQKLEIVCRCGWSAIEHGHDSHTDAAIAAARTLLQDHIDEAIEHVRRQV